jgi:hypothetical protein
MHFNLFLLKLSFFTKNLQVEKSEKIFIFFIFFHLILLIFYTTCQVKG